MTFDPFAIAADIAQCICQALKDPARGDDIWAGECCVRPGNEVSWDSCCENGGQAWVVLKSGYPTTSFPVIDTSTSETTCTSGIVSLGLNFEIGVLRCVCNDLCDCDVAEDSAAKIFGDLKAVLNGLNCCFGAADDGCDRGWRLNGFETAGPMGGCGGVKVNIVVNTNYPCCPPPTPPA